MDVINPSSHNKAMLWNWNLVHGLSIFGCISGVAVFTVTPFITENKTLRGLAVGYGLVASGCVEICYNHLNKIAPRVKTIYDKDTASFRSETLADYHVAHVTNAVIGDYFVNSRKGSLESELDSELIEASTEPNYQVEPSRTPTKQESSAIELGKRTEPTQEFGDIEPNRAEVIKVLQSMEAGETQTEAIYRIWGAKKGSSKAYKNALAKYKMIEAELEED
ncbi:MAG: hypothetical protein AAFO04_24130 [Cyanobacteria bacterium J06592_8]